MELRHLRYFLAVADEGHFGRAAEKLHIVQPALSMQIRSLEEELGTALFVRTSRKVELTEAGAILIAEARRTLAQAERAREIVQQSARGEIGTVKVGFSGNASFVGKLSGDLRSFHRRFPRVEIELKEMSAQQQADAILAAELDVGYCPTFDIDFHVDLNAERIGAWPWLIAMDIDHPLTSRTKISKADLTDEAFVLYAARDAEVAQIALLRHILGKEPKIAHRVGNTLAVLTMAAAGLGLGLVPEPLGKVALPGIEYRPLSDVSTKSDLVLIHRARETSGAIRAFVDLAKRSLTTPG
jgi:DNA-binding transcriptional LysR family regulator